MSERTRGRRSVHTLAAAAGTALLIAALSPGDAARAHTSLAAGTGPATVVVGPGRSIQAALDQAPDGATVLVRPGTYAENLLITRPVRLQAAGAVLVPPAVPRHNVCSSSSPEDRLPGVCVVGDLTIPGPDTTPVVNGYLRDVGISGLRVTGFPGAGIEPVAVDGFVVSGTELDHNGRDGLMSLFVQRIVVRDSRVHDNGLFGITVEDSPTAVALVSGNRVEGNQGPGVLIRSSATGTVRDNLVSGNCAGVFVLRLNEIPVTSVVVRDNRVQANNRYCAPNEDGYPAYAGIGIGVLGEVSSTLVRDNVVTGHRATDGTDLPSAGILLLDLAPLGGGGPQGTVLRGNTVVGNTPLDLLGAGDQRSTVSGNRCGTASPQAWC